MTCFGSSRRIFSAAALCVLLGFLFCLSGCGDSSSSDKDSNPESTSLVFAGDYTIESAEYEEATLVLEGAASATASANKKFFLYKTDGSVGLSGTWVAAGSDYTLTLTNDAEKNFIASVSGSSAKLSDGTAAASGSGKAVTVSEKTAAVTKFSAWEDGAIYKTFTDVDMYMYYKAENKTFYTFEANNYEIFGILSDYAGWAYSVNGSSVPYHERYWLSGAGSGPFREWELSFDGTVYLSITVYKDGTYIAVDKVAAETEKGIYKGSNGFYQCFSSTGNSDTRVAYAKNPDTGSVGLLLLDNGPEKVTDASVRSSIETDFWRQSRSRDWRGAERSHLCEWSDSGTPQSPACP